MYALPTLRFADARTAEGYPLPVGEGAAWEAHDGAWRVRIPLPALMPGTILVPSLAFADPSASEPSAATPAGNASHQWTLEAGPGHWPLHRVPALEAPPAAGRDSPVSAHVDCYRVHRRLDQPVLTLRLDASAPPERYLVCVSTRPFTVARPPRPQDSAALASAPPPRSQLTAPEAIAQRICSPTCVSMVLEAWQRPHDWLALTAECHDPVTGMFGVWPLALRAPARRGSIGAVEVFTGWQEPLAVLRAGVPLVTSIRFAEGELPGAPLAETSGHLVVVHAAGPEWVEVCDPAAAAAEVSRRYPAQAFSEAWLRHRGAAYILPP
jgi:hypothetical protein